MGCGFNRWSQYSNLNALVAEVLKMKKSPGIYYTETQRTLMWERWKQGDSLQMIASCLIEITHRYSGF